MGQEYSLRTDHINGIPFVWDIVRKKWVKLSGEEHVRQQLLHYLIYKRGVARGRIGVEKQIMYNNMIKRFDVVVFDHEAKPWILCECKGPDVAIRPDTIHQVARYNQTLQAPHILLTNGKTWLFFSKNEKGRYQFRESGWLE